MMDKNKKHLMKTSRNPKTTQQWRKQLSANQTTQNEGKKKQVKSGSPTIYLFFCFLSARKIQREPFPLLNRDRFLNCVKIMTKKQVNVRLHL